MQGVLVRGGAGRCYPARAHYVGTTLRVLRGCQTGRELVALFFVRVIIPLLAGSYFRPHFTATIPYELCTLIFTHEIRMQQVTYLQNTE
jgi:hypothetical protein